MAKTFNLNQFPTGTGASGVAFFDLKTRLVSAGWTVIGSGNGTGGSFSVNDGVDRITSASVWADAGNNGPWIILRHPGGYGDWIFGKKNDGTGNPSRSVRVKWTPTPGGFTGNSRTAFVLTGTAPSASDMPSAVDEVVFTPANVNSDLNNTSSNGNAWTGATNDWMYHLMVDTSPPYGWWVLTVIVATGSSPNLQANGMYFDPVLGADPSDRDPWVFCIGQATGGGPWLDATNSQGTGRVGSGGPIAMFNRGRATASRITESPMAMLVSGNGGNQIVLPDGVGSNPFGSGGDIIVPVMYAGRRADSLNVTYPTSYPKGYSSLFYYRPWPLPNGTLLQRASPKDLCVMGKCLVDWDGATVPRF